MLAEITYNAGASCTVGRKKFVSGKTQTVTDAALVKRCQVTRGFCVRVLEEKKAPVKKKQKKVVRKTEKPESTPAE